MDRLMIIGFPKIASLAMLYKAATFRKHSKEAISD